jgi:hypothetical protein
MIGLADPIIGIAEAVIGIAEAIMGRAPAGRTDVLSVCAEVRVVACAPACVAGIDPPPEHCTSATSSVRVASRLATDKKFFARIKPFKQETAPSTYY